MKKFFLVIALVLLVPGLALAGNTTTVSTNNRAITITGLDADWLWSTELASEAREVRNGQIWAIVFYGSAANDRLLIHDGGVDTGVVFDSGLVSGADDPRITYYPHGFKAELVIDIDDADNALTTAANCKVLIILRP